MKNRKSTTNIVVALLISLFLLTFVVSAGAIALERVTEALAVLRVPAEYPTIQAAIDAAEPGDVIQVSPGKYQENLIINKPVSLSARTYDQINPVNNATIIEGSAEGPAIRIPGGMSQMPTIRGFQIRGGSTGIDASSPFIAEYNYLNGSMILTDYKLGAGGVNRFNVYFGAGNDAIRITDVVRPLLIENNRILYSVEDGIEINLVSASNPPTTVDVNIWNNMFIGNREDGIQFVDFGSEPEDANRRFVIVGNLFASNIKAGIGLTTNGSVTEDYSGADTLEAVRVYNNTFFGNDYGISGGDNLIAFNNIIANSNTRGVWRVEGAPGSNSVVAYTLFFGNPIDTEASTLGSGNIIGQDPLFQAAPNPGPDGMWGTVDDDFSGLLLQAASPAIDRGVTQFLAASGEAIPPQPLTQFVGAAPDLGWREFGSPAFVTPTATPFVLFPTAVPATDTLVPQPTDTPFVTSTGEPATPTSTPQPIGSPPASQTPTVTATFTPEVTATSTTTPVVNILKIQPTSAQTGTAINVLITGSGFEAGAIVTFEGGLGVGPQVTAIQVAANGAILLTVAIPEDITYGLQVWDIRVTNPDGSTVVLLDAFTVIPAE